MESKLGNLILLKEEFKQNLDKNNLKEAERLLRLINKEYENIGKKSLLDILNQEQKENIEKCFGKKIKDLIGENPEDSIKDASDQLEHE